MAAMCNDLKKLKGPLSCLLPLGGWRDKVACRLVSDLRVLRHTHTPAARSLVGKQVGVGQQRAAALQAVGTLCFVAWGNSLGTAASCTR